MKKGLQAQELMSQQQLLLVETHSSRASDGSRPADDTGWRLEVPAGVGPTINMQRDEARNSFLASISAHDGDGVLSSGFQRQSRIVPPVPKGEKENFKLLSMSSS